jgi:hypothetical protein
MKWKGVTRFEKGESQPRKNEGHVKLMGERQTVMGGVTISNSSFSREPLDGSNHREVAPSRLEVESTDVGKVWVSLSVVPGHFVLKKPNCGDGLN